MKTTMLTAKFKLVCIIINFTLNDMQTRQVVKNFLYIYNSWLFCHFYYQFVHSKDSFKNTNSFTKKQKLTVKFQLICMRILLTLNDTPTRQALTDFSVSLSITSCDVICQDSLVCHGVFVHFFIEKMDSNKMDSQWNLQKGLQNESFWWTDLQDSLKWIKISTTTGFSPFPPLSPLFTK